MLTIKLEDFGVINRLNALPATVERETTNLIVDMAMWVKADLKQRVPVKTGNLRASIRYDLADHGNRKEATFFSVDYGKWLDEGTGIYGPYGKRIKPKTARAMYWKAENQFLASIKGIKPRNFTQKTFQGALREADHQIDQARTRIFKGVIGR